MDNSDSDPKLFNNCKSLFTGVVEDEENFPSENEWIDLLVNQTLLSFKIDSGAQANIIPKICFRTLKLVSAILKLVSTITKFIIHLI